MKYRKRNGRDTWHFDPRCRWWPKKNFVERAAKPTSGEQCNECLAKKRKAKRTPRD